ncbi:MAG: HAMP domain-containing protein [Proteobacteria bacterium]|nr:HAMP domain-containing protein [Pseudomonadota bacterium]
MIWLALAVAFAHDGDCDAHCDACCDELTEHARPIDDVVERTTTAFEESKLLRVVPAVLDQLQVRELIPILDEVETRDDKDAGDYVLLARLYLRMERPDQALGALTEALTLEPNNANIRLEYASVLLEHGRVDEARRSARAAVRSEPAMRASTAYAAALGWPAPFLGGAIASIWLAALLAWRRQRGVGELLGRFKGLAGGRHVLPVLSVLVSLSLAFQFYGDGDKLAFSLLGVWALGSVGWLAFDPLRAPLRTVWSGLGKFATGRLGKPMSKLRMRALVPIFLVSGFALVSVVKFIADPDIGLVALFACGMLFFTTLGAIILRLLVQSAGLKRSLRWLALGGTLPFLAFFLYAEKDAIRVALTTGSGLTGASADRIVAYLVVWAVGAFLALVLAGIISRSILDPLRKVLGTVNAVQSGDFAARTGVQRRDELGTLGTAVDEMAAGLGERARIEKTFRQYVAVADHLMAAPVEPRRMAAVVLFSDVRGFTSLSERLEPEQVVRLLNRTFGRLAPIVSEHGGVVDKFLGDGMMAVWGVPEPGEQLEAAAVAAGLEMLAAVEELNAELASQDLPALSLGIGINAGPVVAGPVGSSDRKEYTVIGDTVNTAQRAESQARGELVVTGTVADAVKGLFELAARPAVQLKGKTEPVVLYTVEALTPAGG